MAYRSVIVASEPSRIITRNRHLCIETGGGRSGRIPLEDLGVLVLESMQASITSACLHALVSAGGVGIVCGPDHHPSGILLPLQNHSVVVHRLTSQIEASSALKRQVWAQIVRQKIANQSANIRDGGVRRRLRKIRAAVRSGDPRNCEAEAAVVYWQSVFGGRSKFLRRDAGCPENAILNYGYSVLRAALSRAIVAAGLHPALGVHHFGRGNAFCLADDLLEPFRPYVDRYVQDAGARGTAEISAEHRAALVRLLGTQVRYADEHGPMYHAMDQVVRSLVTVFESAAIARGRRESPRADRVAANLILPALEPR